MVFENLTVRRRLAQALVPGLVISALSIASGTYHPASQTMAWFWATYVLYFALFGALVLVPFVTATTHRKGRLAALVIATPALWILFALFSEGLVSLWWDLYPSYYSSACLFLLFSLLLGGLLSLLAPLRFSPRLCMSLGLAGVVMGLLSQFFIEHFLCIFFCDAMDNLPLLVPVILWPVLFCAAVIAGVPGEAPAAEDFIQE